MKLSSCLFACVGFAAAVPLASGTDAPVSSEQAAVNASGVITGYVFDARKKEYVRNAEVSVEGTNISVTSEDDGSYRLAGVPQGASVLLLRYTGCETVRVPVRLEGSSGAVRNLELGAPLVSGVAKGDAVMMESVVVSSEREGNAKAIMSQRRSMDITNSVASDVFGDVAEGNVAEFLKNIPGVELDSVEGDVRTVRLRGLSAEYTSVTLDGISLASADANTGTSGNSRAFSFEQVSLNSMDSIEVSKTVSADMDANAPAGTINLKTKRAFDRQGRRISWQGLATLNSTDYTLSKTDGVDDGKHRKVLPGGILEYSDVLLDRKLGIVLNVSESNVYGISARSTLGYNRNTSASDSRPIVPNSMALTIAPRTTERFSTTLTADYRATPKLNFGLSILSNYNDLWFNIRTATFTTSGNNASGRATVKGDDPLRSFATTSSTTSKVSVMAQAISKAGETWTYLPRFEYKSGNLLVDGRFAYSDSRSWYDPLSRRGSIFSSGTLTNTSTFTGARSKLERSDWNFVQTGGKSWSDGGSFTVPALQVNDGRSSRAKVGSGELNASFSVGSRQVFQIKTGVKAKEERRTYGNERAASYYTYTGPGAATGAWRDYGLPYPMDFGLIQANAVSNTGGALFVPDVQKLTTLYREHPEYFTNTLTAANYYSAYVENVKDYTEDVDAAYLMATTRVARAQFRAGLRWEGTRTDSLEFDARTEEEMAKAGYGMASGLATTIPGVEYQYFSKARVHRKGYYDNYFPSGSFKYRFTQNLDFNLGYSKTIRRPSFSDISGVWLADEEDMTVTAPNVKLKPETSDNLASRLAYYFEPVGILSVSAYQNSVKNLHQTSYLSADQFGYTGTEYSNYTFITTAGSAQRVRIRGLELEYSQSLSFLPKPFSGLNVRANYTRNQADSQVVDMAPHLISGGLSYSYRGLTVYTNLNWTDARPLATYGNYRRQKTTTDLGASYRLGKGLTLFVAARNIFNVPNINLQEYPGEAPTAVNFGYYGTAWTFGLKGTL